MRDDGGQRRNEGLGGEFAKGSCTDVGHELFDQGTLVEDAVLLVGCLRRDGVEAALGRAQGRVELFDLLRCVRCSIGGLLRLLERELVGRLAV